MRTLNHGSGGERKRVGTTGRSAGVFAWGACEVVAEEGLLLGAGLLIRLLRWHLLILLLAAEPAGPAAARAGPVGPAAAQGRLTDR